MCGALSHAQNRLRHERNISLHVARVPQERTIIENNDDPEPTAA